MNNQHTHGASEGRLERFRRVAHALGVQDSFARLAPHVQQLIIDHEFPEIEIRVSHSTQGDSIAEKIAEILCPQLNSLKMTVGPARQEISIQDYISVAISMAHQEQLFLGGGIEPESLRAYSFIMKCKQVALDRTAINEALERLLGFSERTLTEHSYLDRTLYWMSFHDDERLAGMPCRYLAVNLRRQERVRLSLPDAPEPRNAYRCGSHYAVRHPRQLHDVTWGARQLPSMVPPRDYPVYITSHVLEQLDKRLDGIEDVRPHLHDFLWSSMKDAAFCRLSNGDHAVIYNMGKFRLGYVPITFLKDVAVARTFLFLTFDGTPEGTRLWQKLRIDRNDKHELAWDCLSTFLVTDLGTDPGLRDTFNQCGCGHLFTMVNKNARIQLHRGSAEEARKYLRL